MISYMAVFAVIWFTFYAVTNWFYTTKEDKLDRRYELAKERLVKDKVDRYVERDFGGYKATCRGVFKKTCRT